MKPKGTGDASPIYSRSASDGNLADAEEEEPLGEGIPNSTSMTNASGHHHHHHHESRSGGEDRPFFTLPRLMSGKKRSKSKCKSMGMKESMYSITMTATAAATAAGDAGLDSAGVDPAGLRPKGDRMRHRSCERESFFSRMMKQFSAFTLSHHHSEAHRNCQHQVKAHLISASNTDIRSQMVADITECMEMFKEKTPAVCGLRNHGNTCFMNAVIQCLSNTDPLAQYFVMDHYKVDILRRNKIHARKYGTRGEVTQQLAVTLKALWSCEYSPDISQKFKTLVAKHGSQYEGSEQHDAQEFLLWLLDKVHEDLNTATKKKYKKSKSSHGRPDEVVAAETLANHMRCNSSFIHDLFQAQFRSSLMCPSCGKQSNTFDPYLCISLPIPQRQKRPVYVNVVKLHGKSKQVKVGISIDAQATVKELREKVAADYNIPEKQLILTEIDDKGFHRTFSDADPIFTILDSQEIFAVQTPSAKAPYEMEGSYLLLLWINKQGIGSQGHVFGPPYALRVHREITFKELQELLLKNMTDIVKDQVNYEDLGVVLRLRVVGGIPGRCYLPHDVDHPLYMPTVDKALSSCEEASGYFKGPNHLKLILEWDLETKEQLISEKEFQPVEDKSYLQLKNQQQQVLKATLNDCFELYFKEEKLGPEDAWMCTNCRRRQQGVKKLSLWSVPDVFIIHLKRFRQASTQRTKLTTLVEFPISNLDMGPFIAHRHSDFPNHLLGGGMSMLPYWSPWKRPRVYTFPRCEDSAYELYAVCNHHGNMQGGHYTAYCKNPVDGHWYLFDDTKVTPVTESEVVTADAYILFYQRTSLLPSSCASSSTSGYSSASNASLVNTCHWAYRMPPFSYWPPKASKSQDNLCDSDGPGDVHSFVRGQRAYKSMPTKTRKHSNCADISNEPDHRSDEEAVLDDDVPSPPPPPKRYWTVTSV